MKKLIVLIMLMFITTGVFGQKFIRSHSFIESTPTGNNTIEDAINRVNIKYTNFDWIAYVHFIENGNLYLLSYEPKEKRTSGGIRAIYLYCKDITDVNSSWVKASDVVMTNNWINPESYCDVDFFRSEKSRGSLGKVVVEADCVKITIAYEVFSNSGVMISEPHTFIFKPKGNNFYIVDNDSSSI